MKIAKVIFFSVIFMIVAIMVTKFNYDIHITEIKKWTKAHNMIIVNYDINQTIIGSPFYYLNDGCAIYEVNVITQDGKNKRLWVRDNGMLNDDYIIE